MKLYYWRVNDYAEEALVVAEDLAAARAALEATRLPQPTVPRPEDTHRPRRAEDHNAWFAWHDYDFRNRLVDRMLALDGYTLEVLEPGQVAWAERS